MLLSILPHQGDLFRQSRIYLIDYGNARHKHIGFTPIIQEFMPGTVGVEQHNENVR